MKKIMFNDRYGLTQAVLEGLKTMTRRILEVPIKDFNSVRIALLSEENKEVNKMAIIKKYAKYQVGDEVAVVQAYEDVYHDADFEMVDNEFMTESAGWNNKMFVRADLMPHRIRITDVKVERLQDISDDDCMKEGIYTRAALHSLHVNGYAYTFDNWSDRGIAMGSDTAKGAFASLIDKISGKGTWERNPWVYAYEFEIIK